VLFKLLGLPLSLPMAGMKFLFQQVADMADQELNDDTVVREQLLLLQLQLEEGDIEEDDFAEQEAVLLARLREIRARKRWESEQAAADEIPAEANVEARRRVVVETPFDER
jgi:hypothetical protein